MTTKTTQTTACFSPLSCMLAASGLPDLAQLIDELLVDPATARRVAHVMDHGRIRHQLEAAGCRVRESNGLSLLVDTQAGGQARLTHYRRQLAQRVSIHVTNGGRLNLEIHPGELPEVLAWLPKAIDAAAGHRTLPAVPCRVQAARAGSLWTVSAAAADLTRA